MTALAAVGVYGIVMTTKQWKSLSDRQQAMLITGGAALAIEFVCAIVKRGVAIGAVLGDSSIGAILKGLWTGEIFSNAYDSLQSSFGQWIVERDVDFRFFIRDPVEPGLVGKIFGRNLDDFLATRLGAIVNVIFLVLSIWNAVDAGDSLERMADGWMAAAAGLDLIAATAGWALGAAGIGDIGGYAVASICSFIGGLGILAAVVGIAILLYMIFKPQKNSVQQFTSDYAAPAGFFMSYGSEIDYFTGYAQEGEPQRLGCSFAVDANAGTVLSVANDGTTVESAPQSFDYNSVFVISTDG